MAAAPGGPASAAAAAAAAAADDAADPQRSVTLRPAEIGVLLAGVLPPSLAAKLLPPRTEANTVTADGMLELRRERSVEVLDKGFQNQLDILGMRIEDRVDADAGLGEMADAYGKLLTQLHRRLALEAAAEEEKAPQGPVHAPQDPAHALQLLLARSGPDPRVDYPSYKGLFTVRFEVDFLGHKWQFEVGESPNVRVTYRFAVSLRPLPAGAAAWGRGLAVPVVTGGDEDGASSVEVPVDTYFVASDGRAYVRSSALGGVMLRSAGGAGAFQAVRDEDGVPPLVLSCGPQTFYVLAGRELVQVSLKGKIKGRVQLPQQCLSGASGPDGSVYLVRGGTQVYKVDKDGIVSTYNVQHGAHLIAVGKDGRVYASYSNHVRVYDSNQLSPQGCGQPTATLQAPEAFSWFCVAGDGGVLVGSNTGNTYVLRPNSPPELVDVRTFLRNSGGAAGVDRNLRHGRGITSVGASSSATTAIVVMPVNSGTVLKVDMATKEPEIFAQLEDVRISKVATLGNNRTLLLDVRNVVHSLGADGTVKSSLNLAPLGLQINTIFA